MLPFINANANPLYRAQKSTIWGRPLTKSYPVGTLMVTTGNGSAAPPGQPASLVRVNKSGLQAFGDPRASGSFYNISSNSDVQSLLTGQAPNITGGSTINISQPGISGADVNWFYVAAAGLGLLWLLGKI